MIDWKNIAIQITRRTHDRLTARYVNRKTGSMYPLPLLARFVDVGKERIMVKVSTNPEYWMRREDFPDIGETARFATGKLSASDTLNERSDFSATGTHGFSYVIEPAPSRTGNRFELWRHWRDGLGGGILMTFLDHLSCDDARGCECCRQTLEYEVYNMKWAYLRAQDLRRDLVAYYISYRSVKHLAQDAPADFVAWDLTGQPVTWPRPKQDPDLVNRIRSMDSAEIENRICSMAEVESSNLWRSDRMHLY